MSDNNSEETKWYVTDHKYYNTTFTDAVDLEQVQLAVVRTVCSGKKALNPHTRRLLNDDMNCFP